MDGCTWSVEIILDFVCIYIGLIQFHELYLFRIFKLVLFHILVILKKDDWLHTMLCFLSQRMDILSRNCLLSCLVRPFCSSSSSSSDQTDSLEQCLPVTLLREPQHCMSPLPRQSLTDRPGNTFFFFIEPSKPLFRILLSGGFFVGHIYNYCTDCSLPSWQDSLVEPSKVQLRVLWWRVLCSFVWHRQLPII